jgi:hypothetical protein
MSSSTSSSSRFFPRAVACLTMVAAVTLMGGRLGGRAVRALIDRTHTGGKLWAEPLGPQGAVVRTSQRYLALLGNSRFDAAIDPERLAHDLGEGVVADPYFGGGWDALHYYMLAVLAQDVLRPGRDAVVIEISPLSIDDAAADNRLSFIPRPAAGAIAALPGAPLETRLNVLLGAAASLYRYRVILQGYELERRLPGAAALLRRVGLLGGPPRAPRFEVRTPPGHELVIAEVRGDRDAFTAENRARLDRTIGELRLGGYKLAALERAVELLHAAGLTVYLVETPISNWLHERLYATAAGARYVRAVTALAARTGAVLVRDWPARFGDEATFWDDSHMVAPLREAFTDLLARRLRPP